MRRFSSCPQEAVPSRSSGKPPGGDPQRQSSPRSRPAPPRSRYRPPRTPTAPVAQAISSARTEMPISRTRPDEPISATAPRRKHASAADHVDQNIAPRHSRLTTDASASSRQCSAAQVVDLRPRDCEDARVEPVDVRELRIGEQRFGEAIKPESDTARKEQWRRGEGQLFHNQKQGFPRCGSKFRAAGPRP